ncbi:MAG: hypothetical protein P8M20_09170 [Planctomycetaceae bacterium]|nr:hypothetical protein [Planctomycetaceae bacterium]
MRTVTPGRSYAGKFLVCHALPVQSVVWTLDLLRGSVGSDNLGETDG